MANKQPTQQQSDVENGKDLIDYTKRAQWLRAAVLGANDGLVSTASLMMGVGAVKQDVKPMILSGVAGLVAGACSMAIGEFVSTYSERDIKLAQMKRDGTYTSGENEAALPSPKKDAAASSLAFSVGAVVPLLAASFIRDYKVRVGAVVAAVTVALLLVGWLGAFLGKAPIVKGSIRVLFGGWIAMGITFGITKLIGSRV